MESGKLKNIVLLILVVTNLLLLGLLLSQRMQSRQADRQTLDNAVALLADQGITVEERVLPRSDFPPVLSLERDTDWELEVFTSLLGSPVALTQRGLVSHYEGPLGEAEVRGDGVFAVRLHPGAYPLDGLAMDDHALRVLERMSYAGQVTDRAEDGVTVRQDLVTGEGDPIPLFSCTADLTYEDDSLTAIAGTRLVGPPAADGQGEAVLSLPTLLVRFRGGILDSGDACNAIHGARQGYALDSDAGVLRLIPVLQLETDTNVYYLSALTGGFEPM